MLKLISPAALGLFLLTVLPASADIVLTDSFTYTDTNLAVQGGWVQVGADGNKTIQIANGMVHLGPSGQDAAKPFTAPITAGTVYIGFDLTVETAQTGDFFMALSPNADGTGNLTDRLWVQAATGATGYVLGQAPAIVPTYGTEVLQFGHSYRIVYSFTAGSDASIFVDPKPTADPASLTPYAKLAAHNTFADGAGYKALAVIQNVSTKAPTLNFGNLVVATTFAEAATPPKAAAPATSTAAHP